MREGDWEDDYTGRTKARKYIDPWEKRRGENDSELAERIEKEWLPYVGIVADTLARSKADWDTDEEADVDIHGVMHHEILVMANKVLGIPDKAHGNSWHNGQMRPMSITLDTDGFLGRKGSTMEAQTTEVWNPMYPRKYNLKGVDDLPDDIRNKHRDAKSVVPRLTRRQYDWIGDKFK